MASTIPARVIDGGHFRRVLGQYPTGVSVVTALGDQGPLGMTVGTFTSVSLDPPLVAFLPMKGSRVLQALEETGRFAVNFLAGDQLDLCRRFASREDDKFRSIAWHESPLGSPVLDGAPAWIDCRLEDVFEIGDHVMVVGRVHDLDVERPTVPLMFFQGGFGRFSALSVIADTDDLGVHLRLAELARARLEELSSAFGVHAAASALVGEQVIQLAWVGASRKDLETNLVGLRLPFVAPFGLHFAAWATDAVRDAWLDGVADGPREVLLDDVVRARRQGWAIIPDHDILRDIEASIAQIATDGRLPAAVRELDAKIADFAAQYTALSEQRPRGVSVPVFDHIGRVVLTLTAQRLPEMTPARLEECRAALIAAGEELTRVIDGVRHAD
jgi:flavin reductase (DIM6/NTAB) family NADH-FMN oxidoreductase RutF/DNA-binding IclR family transcriptional regulator